MFKMLNFQNLRNIFSCSSASVLISWVIIFTCVVLNKKDTQIFKVSILLLLKKSEDFIVVLSQHSHLHCQTDTCKFLLKLAHSASHSARFSSLVLYLEAISLQYNTCIINSVFCVYMYVEKV